MKLGKTYFSGSLTFDGGNNSIGPNTSNITGSFTGSLKGALTATGDIIPSVSGAFDLGSTAFPFKDLYITQNSLKFVDQSSGQEIGRISVNSNTGDIKLLNTKNLSEEEKATLTAESAGAEALSPVSASALWVSQSIFAGHANTNIGHEVAPFHTLHTQFVSGSSATLTGDLRVGGKVTAQEFHTEFVSASIVYQSGSTKFGDSVDDIHEFTGNVDIRKAQQTTPFTDPFIKLNPESTTNETGHTTITLGTSPVDNYGVSLSGWRYGTDGDPKFRIKMHSNSATGTDALIIDSNGNTGIGRTVPESKLDVGGHVRSYSSSINYGEIRHGAFFAVGDHGSSLLLDLESTGAADLVNIKSSGTSRFYIKNDGNVGIGEDSPISELDIKSSNPQIVLNSTVNTSNKGILFNYNGTNYGEITHNAQSGKLLIQSGDTGQSGYYIDFGIAGSSEMRIVSTGRVGIGTTGPNAKLHVNVTDIGIASNYATVIIEDVDSQLDIISSAAGTWGSSLNFIEGNGASNTNSWSIARSTSGHGSKLNFNFGTANQHDNDTKVTFTADGDVGIGVITPGAKLDITQPTGGTDTLHAENTSTNNVIRLSAANGYKNYLDTYSGASLGTFVLRNSNVGIGTTSPQADLDVVGKIASDHSWTLTYSGFGPGDEFDLYEKDGTTLLGTWGGFVIIKDNHRDPASAVYHVASGPAAGFSTGLEQVANLISYKNGDGDSQIKYRIDQVGTRVKIVFVAGTGHNSWNNTTTHILTVSFIGAAY